jgi:hypothetical protein
MFRRKPSPEMDAINREAEEIGAADVERKSTLERLIGHLSNPLTDPERKAFKALLLTDERRECPAVLHMRINR